MHFDRYELMMLSRGGRVPRPVSPGPRYAGLTPSELDELRAQRPPALAGLFARATRLLRGRRERADSGGRLDAQAYLALEFPRENDR